MAEHLRSTVWALRFDMKTYVRTDSPESLLIYHNGEALTMSRRDARLLARRINQCLDETQSKPKSADPSRVVKP